MCVKRNYDNGETFKYGDVSCNWNPHISVCDIANGFICFKIDIFSHIVSDIGYLPFLSLKLVTSQNEKHLMACH